jgi:coatomer subunit beta'
LINLRTIINDVQVVWSESGELVALICPETTYILRFNREAYVEGVNAGLADEDGVEAAFELMHEVSDAAVTAHWIGDSLVYTTEGRQLKQLIGEQTDTIAHFDQSMYVLRYLPRDGRLYLCDKDVNIISYTLSTTVVEYQTLVLRGDMEGAESLLPDVPANQMNKIARFLESQGHKDLALEVATDPEHRFELALSLNNLAIALEIAKQQDTEHKYKMVGDAAMAGFDLKTAEEMFVLAKDIGSLLLLYTSSGNKEKLIQLAKQAEDAGSHNIAFATLWSSEDIDACIDLLLRAGRPSEAVLLSHTYKPSRTVELVALWKEGLDKQGKSKVSRLLGVPGQDDDLFPEWDEYIKLENQGGKPMSANLVDVDEEKVNGTTNGDVDGDDVE